MLERNTKGASVRSRARWIEFGEKNSKYFFGLEKRQNDKKSIRLLRNSQGVLISQQKKVSNELVDFYKSLFSEDQHLTENECFEFLQKFSPPTVSAAEKQHCDRRITENECFKAISQLSNNKFPGLDEFSTEFYKVFWEVIKSDFLDCLNFSMKNLELCNSQYEGVITLLLKPGKDHLYASNYRPITLLNCDYKIFSKVINNRLISFLPKLIHYDQNGFIKGRSIGDNIRLIFDIIDYANRKNVPGAVLSIDLYKAFDSLNWPFIFAALKCYGFGKSIIEWIRRLYKQPQCCIIITIFSLFFFNVKKGVRQGGPLSPTTFV